ncbi:MAG: hypothetical protein J6R44_03290 [Clostridia bacterium]|nr:hypothetical protein [Clostridia bacterium]
MGKNGEIKITKNWFNRFLSVMLMTLALVVVLSTATFAWYNISNMVSIEDIYFQASIKDDVGGDLCMSWHVLQEDEYEYDLPIRNVTENNVLYPMIPKMEGVVGTTTFTDYASSGKFNRATQSLAESGGWIINLDSKSNTTPYSLMQEDGDATEFYLTNKSETEMQVKVTYEISASTYVPAGGSSSREYAIANKFRGAIFSTDGTDGEMKLRGLMAKNQETINYGVLQDRTSVESNVNSVSATEDITIIIPAKSYVKARIVIWFDGVDMVDEDGEKNVEFSIFFDAPLVEVEG